MHLQRGEVASQNATPPPPEKKKKPYGNSSGFTLSFFFLFSAKKKNKKTVLDLRSGGGGCRLTVYHVDSARTHAHAHSKLDTWSVDAGALPRGPSFLST